MKLNHFICPTCGHDFYADAAYATCDGCQTMFYASQSQTCQPRSRVLPMQHPSNTGGGYWLDGTWIQPS